MDLKKYWKEGSLWGLNITEACRFQNVYLACKESFIVRSQMLIIGIIL